MKTFGFYHLFGLFWMKIRKLIFSFFFVISVENVIQPGENSRFCMDARPEASTEELTQIQMEIEP